jgi:ribosomal protein L22
MSEDVDKTAEDPEVTQTSGETASKSPEAEVTPEPVAADASESGEVEVAADAAASPKPVRARGSKAKAAAEDAPAEDAAVETAPAEKAPAAKAPAAKAPAAPAPRRSRSRREPGEAAPVVRAQAKYVRSSARKARLVCDHIRGKSVEDARAILAHTPRAVARDWSKLLESAVANAEHNHELVGEDLYIKVVQADEGPTIKRFRPRAMGRATSIRKRTTHLTILLTPKD